MSHLRSHHGTGLIPRASGAAVAALKARAAMWEAPLVEDEAGLSLLIWGSELRLTRQADALRIDLLAPEDRLVGILRDSATEILAEAGVEVAWDDVDAGALAPGLALLRVAGVSRPVPGFLRVRLAGPQAGQFAQGGYHFRLLLPPAGRAAVWPRVAASGRTVWPDGADALHRPVYTVVDHGPGWLDFDIFCHPGSPTCDWAQGAPLGQQVGAIGPGGGGCPDTDRLWLFGDQTAMPAITRMLAETRGTASAVLCCDAADLGALADDPRVTRCDDLMAALEAMPDPAGGHVWFAADAARARAARSHLLSRGLTKTQFTAAAYWSRAEA